MKLTGVKFAYPYQSWTSGYWPVEVDIFLQGPYVMYDEASHTVCLPAVAYHGSIPPDSLGFFRKKYPDLRSLTKKEIAQIEKRYKQEARNTDAARKRKAFDDAVIGSVNLTNDRVLRRYLAGEAGNFSDTGRGGSGLNIQGDTLNYYNGTLMQRIGVNEYLLGRELTTLAKNSPSCTARILAVLSTQQDIILWPTLRSTSISEHDTSLESCAVSVFSYCERIFQVCQLKMPTARNKDSYNDIFHDNLVLYERGKRRWKLMSTKCESLIKVYGDIPSMKEMNAALRMQFEMTGEVEI